MSLTPARQDARAIGLRYVDPDGPGIQRRRAGRGFRYLDVKGRPIRSADELERIRAIAVPPAWTDVWICPDPDGHLQATGRDARGRRQYRYHRRFRARRDDGKFGRLVRFGTALPRIRRRVRHDLARRGLPREKVLAAVVSLLETTRFRVGNAEYARLNRSFGISTLRNRHATVSGATIRFRFRGKGGRSEERTLVDRRMAAVVRRCQELPGQGLFQYVDPDGEERAISSDDVNDYIREAAGIDEFSAKDFRTWVATVLAYRALRTPTAAEPGGGAAAGAARRAGTIRDAMERTAEQLNNTVTVTRNSYVHPAVLEAFQAEGDPAPNARRRAGRTGTRDDDAAPIERRDELAVMEILRRSARRSARRSQVDGPRVADRARRPAA